MSKIALGLDSSTQGLAAVALDIDSRAILWEHALDYLGDSRLTGFGLGPDYILPPSEPGEANQPAALYIAALEAMTIRENLPPPTENISRLISHCSWHR